MLLRESICAIAEPGRMCGTSQEPARAELDRVACESGRMRILGRYRRCRCARYHSHGRPMANCRNTDARGDFTDYCRHSLFSLTPSPSRPPAARTRALPGLSKSNERNSCVSFTGSYTTRFWSSS